MIGQDAGSEWLMQYLHRVRVHARSTRVYAHEDQCIDVTVHPDTELGPLCTGGCAPQNGHGVPSAGGLIVQPMRRQQHRHKVLISIAVPLPAHQHDKCQPMCTSKCPGTQQMPRYLSTASAMKCHITPWAGPK